MWVVPSWFARARRERKQAWRHTITQKKRGWYRSKLVAICCEIVCGVRVRCSLQDVRSARNMDRVSRLSFFMTKSRNWSYFEVVCHLIFEVKNDKPDLAFFGHFFDCPSFCHILVIFQEKSPKSCHILSFLKLFSPVNFSHRPASSFILQAHITEGYSVRLSACLFVIKAFLN